MPIAALPTQSETNEMGPPDSTHPWHGLARFLAWAGLKSLAVAVISLILLRGLDPRIIALFGIPPLLAVIFTNVDRPRSHRRIAWGFLIAIGVGSLVAYLPGILPKLGGTAPKLGPTHDRLLTWYGAVYLTWVLGVIPVLVFVKNAQAHGRGQPAQLSRFTCYAGLFTTALLCLSFPVLFQLLGFWPLW